MKTLRQQGAFLACWVLAVLWGPQAQAAQPITVRADLWMPYNGYVADTLPGYMVEVVREIFEPLDRVVDYELMSWNRALEECRQGRITAIIGAGEDRKEDFLFPEEEIGWSGYAWFVRSGFHWQFSGLESLSRVRLGVCDTCTYDEALDAYILAHRETEAVQPLAGEDMVDKNLAKLIGNRIDVFYEDPVVVRWALIRLGAEDKVALANMAPPEKFERIFMGFSRALPEAQALAQQFDAGIRRLRATGRLAEILAKYNLEDWKSQLPAESQ
ncbi:substrate-binding periplasmic protein [Megalodesulfovibrio paquesii]